MMIEITAEILDRNKIISSVERPESGGICSFFGTVRNHSKERSVVRLEFEAYKDMALKELMKIASQIENRWSVNAIAIHHRIGTVKIGEDAVVISISSAHRDEAFKACRYAIDTLKETVPIWKKEILEDGEEWVSAHP